jgi:hypothetical protein
LPIEKIVIVEKKEILGQSVLALDGGSVYLRNASIEQAVSRTYHERVLISDGVGQAYARRHVIGIEGNLARVRPQRIGFQSFHGKRLQVIARAQA